MKIISYFLIQTLLFLFIAVNSNAAIITTSYKESKDKRTFTWQFDWDRNFPGHVSFKPENSKYWDVSVNFRTGGGGDQVVIMNFSGQHVAQVHDGGPIDDPEGKKYSKELDVRSSIGKNRIDTLFPVHGDGFKSIDNQLIKHPTDAKDHSHYDLYSLKYKRESSTSKINFFFTGRHVDEPTNISLMLISFGILCYLRKYSRREES